MIYSRLRIGIAALACAILAACGAGDSPAPAAANQQKVVVSGAITGFGSVFVNGVRFDTSGASILKDGVAATQQGLRVGQIVHLKGRIGTDGRAFADQIQQCDDLEGPITAIDPIAQTFVVLAHTVHVTPETSFDESVGTSFAALTLGMQVEVSGMPAANGDIIATRIEARHPGGTRLEVLGMVAELDAVAHKFHIRNLVIDYSGASLQDFGSNPLANGQLVEVKGTALNPAGELLATRIELRDFDDEDGEFRREIEGLVTRYVSATDFDVAGRPVTTTSSTRFENGTAADLALNVKVEAEGSINDAGVLVATQIQFRRGHNAAVAGIVDAVSADASGFSGTLTVLGVTITVDSTTRIEDKSDLRIASFRLADLAPGDYVRVRGTETGPLMLTASRLERRRLETRSWLRGTVRNLAQPNLTVLGVPVVTTATTDFEDSTAAEFFATADGRVVNVRGTETSNTLLATDIELHEDGDHDDGDHDDDDADHD
jgi:hypothetical protein